MSEFKCTRRDCYAHQGDFCAALTEETTRKPCPFFKTRKQYAEDRQRAAEMNEAKEALARSIMLEMLENDAGFDGRKHTKNRR